MNHSILDTFNHLKQENKKALIPFITAHYPNRDLFNYFLNQMPNNGANIIEIGIPFSDPMADGEVIQKTSFTAIKNGFKMDFLFDDIRSFKNQFPTIPIVLMTYLNPLIQYGMDSFLKTANENGVNGILIVDLPPENFGKVIRNTHGLDMIRLVTATTSNDRVQVIQQNASGFIYYVSIKGVTGSKLPNPAEIKQHLDDLNDYISLPKVIGFGINSIDSAKQMAEISDGIVIGSSLLKPLLDIDESLYKTSIDSQLLFLSQVNNAINK